MLRWLTGLDRLAAASRPAWGWLGELAVVVLGIHLAADRLDDWILAALAPVELPWPSPDFPLQLATWTAVTAELWVAAWAAFMLWRSRNEAVTSAREWAHRASVSSVLAALAWAPLALVGAWVVAMAIEDVTAPLLGTPALWLSWVVAGLIAWRLGLSGWLRVARQAPQPRRRIEGWWLAPPVVLVTVLAVRHGLPVHSLQALWAAVGG